MTSKHRSPGNERNRTIERIDHIALVVTSVETSVAWYLDMFGFESFGTSSGSSVTYVGNSSIRLAMLEASDESPFSPPVNQGARACHFAFRTNGAGYVGYQNKLDREGISYDKLTHIDSQSIYFSDPDGYVIEVTTYDDV